jgi:hypothetical protein
MQEEKQHQTIIIYYDFMYKFAGRIPTATQKNEVFYVSSFLRRRFEVHHVPIHLHMNFNLCGLSITTKLEYDDEKEEIACHDDDQLKVIFVSTNRPNHLLKNDSQSIIIV